MSDRGREGGGREGVHVWSQWPTPPRLPTIHFWRVIPEGHGAGDICCVKRRGPVSYLQCVVSQSRLVMIAYPLATAHMLGTRNSWTWPWAKLGQTATDGAQNSPRVTIN